MNKEDIIYLFILLWLVGRFTKNECSTVYEKCYLAVNYGLGPGFLRNCFVPYLDLFLRSSVTVEALSGYHLMGPKTRQG